MGDKIFKIKYKNIDLAKATTRLLDENNANLIPLIYVHLKLH